MAWREALRDFYSRIAGRLQAAEAGGESSGASWVAVRVAGMPCLLPLKQSGEIFPAESLQGLPYTRPWFLGVANLRGELFPVIDLAAYLQACQQEGHQSAGPPLDGGHRHESRLHSGQETMPATGALTGAAPSSSLPAAADVAIPASAAAGPGWLVTLHPSLQAHSALRVDRLEGLRAPSELGPAIDADGDGACGFPPVLAPWVLSAHADPSGMTWFVLDLHRIVSQPGFLHVHA